MKNLIQLKFASAGLGLSWMTIKDVLTLGYNPSSAAGRVTISFGKSPFLRHDWSRVGLRVAIHINDHFLKSKISKLNSAKLLCPASTMPAIDRCHKLLDIRRNPGLLNFNTGWCGRLDCLCYTTPYYDEVS